MNVRQHGFSLVSVIFLLVVLAVVVTYAVTISSVQQQTSADSILSSRAEFAAESGTQWAIRTVLSDNSCAAFPADFSLTGGAADGFRIEAECSLSTYTENPETYNVYRLSVIASRGSVDEPDYVSRRVLARVTDAP